MLQVEGTPERPRLAVFRSNNHIYAQVRRRAVLRSSNWQHAGWRAGACAGATVSWLCAALAVQPATATDVGCLLPTGCCPTCLALPPGD